MGTNAFVSKLTPDGTALTYSTFLSGSCGSVGQAISVDAAGDAVVVGFTTSPDFPSSSNSYQPVFPGPPGQINPPNALYAGFVAKLSPAGDKLLAGTYLGGGYLTEANAVAVDSAGNVAVTGETVKMALGATPGGFQQQPADHCVPTLSIGPSPPQFGTYDAFVLKLDPTLSVARYLTYLGGACDDAGMGIALDPAGNTWIVGSTYSPDFPLKAPFESQGIGYSFVSELSADGSQLLFSSGTDAASLALDTAGAAYLAGSTSVAGSPKLMYVPGQAGSTAELLKIDTAAAPPIVIDGITAVTGYPVTVPPPFISGIAPGQLLQITGRNLGPAMQINGQLDSTERLPVTLANTTVYFEEIPSPLISVNAMAIQCFAPFEITRTTNVTVESNGQKSNTFRFGVAISNPQILSIANQDGTLNSVAHPAPPGSVVVLYASGLGETAPLSVDGLENSAPLAVPLTAVTVNLPNATVKPQF